MKKALEELRSRIGARSGLVERESISYSKVSCGIPKSAVTTITGVGKTEFTVQFLVENKKISVAWLEEEFSIYPCGFAQRDFSLERVLFIEPGHEILWAALQVVRSGLFEVVVIKTENIKEKAMRKLQLAAERSRAAVILLQETEEVLWPAKLQLGVLRSEDEDLLVRLIRKKL